MITPRTIALAAVLALGTIAVPAAAQSKAPAADAQAKFEAAQKLFDAKKFAEALPRFRDAFASTGSPNARLYVARCLRELGELGEAHAEMSAALADATALAAKQPRYAQTRDAASAELADFEKRVAFLTLSIEGAGEGLEVRLGDRPVAPDRLGKALVMAPGKIALRVAAPGRAPYARDLELVAGRRETVAVALVAAAPSDASPPSPVAPPDRATPPEPAVASGGGVRTAGFAVAGLGVAGVAVFAITGSMARSKFNTVESECGGVRCTDPSYSDEISSGRTLTTVANVGLVVGIAGLVGGGLMIALGGPSAPASGSAAAAPAGLSFSASPSGGGVSLSRRF